jgi:hypothetical protein
MEEIKLQDAMLVWMDDIPLEEITSEKAIDIIKEYKSGDICAGHAIIKLSEQCMEEIEEWASFNSKLQEVS